MDSRDYDDAYLREEDPHVKAAFNAGKTLGQKQMRERAANEMRRGMGDWQLGLKCEEAIRNLEITE